MPEENSDTGTQDQSVTVKSVKFIGIPECFSSYSNLAQVIATAFDIQIVFGEMIESEDEIVQAHAKARIVMSPEQAFLLMKALQSRVHFFAQMHGTLREGVIASITSANKSIPPG